MVQLQRQRPEIKTLFMSGYTRDTMKEQGVDVGEMAFLQKPVSPSTLANAVRALLDGTPVVESGAEPVCT
jgi:DNA-binding NarL/FixJ family response regulator